MNQPWYEWGMWVYRASVAQANGAGGAIVVDITPTVGGTMIVVSAIGTNSGTNTLRIERVDEDNTVAATYVAIGSAAATSGAMPQSTAFAETSRIVINSISMETRLFRGDDYLTIKQTGAGAQNDTLVVFVRALLSSSRLPTVSKARSTNQADVTIATPTVDKIL